MYPVVERLQAGVRLLHTCLQRFDRHQGLLRASALSFDTTLGLVPLLALVFVGLKLAGIQNLLGPYLVQQLAGSSPELGVRLVDYVNRLEVGSLGLFGVAGLFLMLVMLLENVRDAFNAVWEVQEQRSLLQRLAHYLVLLCAAPVLLTMAFGITSLLQSRELVQWLINTNLVGDGVLLLFKLTPYLCSSLVLLLAYLLLPCTPVRFSSALAGAMLTGAVWQTAHWCYFRFQIGVARYSVIYGALAFLPFLLIWFFTSWLLVLLGLELVCYHQQRNHLNDQPPCREKRG